MPFKPVGRLRPLLTNFRLGVFGLYSSGDSIIHAQCHCNWCRCWNGVWGHLNWVCTSLSTFSRDHITVWWSSVSKTTSDTDDNQTLWYHMPVSRSNCGCAPWKTNSFLLFIIRVVNAGCSSTRGVSVLGLRPGVVALPAMYVHDIESGETFVAVEDCRVSIQA